MIKFTIPGYPVGYLRLTQGQLKLLHIPDHKLRPAGLRKKSEILRCFAYKNDVVKCSNGKGIDRKPKRKIHMKTMIYFRSGARPDAENVHKLNKRFSFPERQKPERRSFTMLIRLLYSFLSIHINIFLRENG